MSRTEKGVKPEMSFKGRHHTAEAKEKISRTLLGRKKSLEAVEKSRRARSGKLRTPEQRENIRQGTLAYLQAHPEKTEQNSRWHTGRCLSPETVAQIRRGHNTPEYCEKIRLRDNDPKYLKKWTKSMHAKNRPEKYLESLLQEVCPEQFAYNGRYDCGITIDGLIPDFVNVNGRKQVIDVHGDYWHNGENVAIRQARYAKYGYSSLIVWERELKDEIAVTQRISEFVSKGG